MTWFTILKMPAGVANNRGPLGGKTWEGWFTPEELEEKKDIWPIGDDRILYLLLSKARGRMKHKYGNQPSERFRQMHGYDNFRIKYNKEVKEFLIQELEQDYENKMRPNIRRHGGQRLSMDSEEWKAKYGNYRTGWWQNESPNPPRQERVAEWEENQGHKKRMRDMDRKDQLSEQNMNEKIRGWKDTLYYHNRRQRER